MSDVAIRELCAGQFRIDQFDNGGGRSSYNPLYCSFANVNEYADNSLTRKYCSRNYYAADNYYGAANWFDTNCLLPAPRSSYIVLLVNSIGRARVSW